MADDKYGVADALKEKSDESIGETAKDFTAVTPETWGGESPVGLSSKKHKEYPRFSLNLKDIEEAKDWEVGKQYTIELAVEMTSLRMDENREEVGFAIIGVDAGDELPEAEHMPAPSDEQEEDDEGEGESDDED